ncbi:PREDICTED: MFS-type transporter SLC18B1-like isoform X2 [Nicrophorus vespilloides]|nr:PREDICTED: MFS-type transporter SLC18B1-like isoform X2 [Nicrophorus vespilloides]
MEKDERIQAKSSRSSSPDFRTPPSSTITANSESRIITSSISTPSSNPSYRPMRSKSMSNICAESYTTGDIRRIKERLLRMNSHVEPAVIKKFSREQKLTLASLALVDFMSFCSMSIMAPFFPREAAEKGLSDTLSGFVFSFYALVMFLTSPIFGKLTPKLGPKFLFLSGMFTAGACNLLFGMLEYIHDYTLFTTFCLIIRGLEALGASAFSTASYVFVINTFPNNIGSVLGILETFVGLGMSTGPAIGGILYSLGGFDLPFFVLGITMILIIPINVWLLPSLKEFNMNNNSISVLKLIKLPAVIITGLIVVVASSTWAFLDPTLEPHLRQFDLAPEKIGLIFLLFSALYGISSPIWGWLADKVNNHWSMMICGLFFSTIGLLLLGPTPYIAYLESSLWLNLVALSILGISVALALLPTFQSVLTSAVEGGCTPSMQMYSVVAGTWSCMYSLGEVIGPSLGGFLLQNYGFPITSTIMAGMTFSLSLIGLVYFSLRSRFELKKSTASESDFGDSWNESNEKTPLLVSLTDTDHRLYTEEKVQCYEQSRRMDNQSGDIDYDQITDVRGTVAITGKGACEV